MFVPHNTRDGPSRHLSRTTSGKPLSEDERRERLREAGRLKLNMFKQRQLQELQRNEPGGAFANLFSLASPLVSPPEVDNETELQQMGSPMSKRQHTRRSSSPCSRQPRSDSAAGASSIEMAAQPKIKPTFRPIRSPSEQQAPAKASSPTADQTSGPAANQMSGNEGLEDMVQILLQQVAQLQAEKQQIRQRCSALELENANLQELVGFLSEAADMSDMDGSLEVCEQDLEEIYTVIVEDNKESPESPAVAAA